MWPPAVSSSHSCSTILQYSDVLYMMIISQFPDSHRHHLPTALQFRIGQVPCSRPHSLAELETYIRNPEPQPFLLKSKKQQCSTFPTSPGVLLVVEDEAWVSRKAAFRTHVLYMPISVPQGNLTSPPPWADKFGLFNWRVPRNQSGEILYSWQ